MRLKGVGGEHVVDEGLDGGKRLNVLVGGKQLQVIPPSISQ